MPFVLALLLVAFPSNSRTSWMRLESFHLTIGMTRDDMVKEIAPWNPKYGRDKNEILIDYAGDKSLTLELKNNRLHSVRFELFAYLADIRKAFEEQKAHLRESRGAPRKATASVLIYDDALPNVMAVVKDDPKSEQAKKGLEMLTVRYYDPR